MEVNRNKNPATWNDVNEGNCFYKYTNKIKMVVVYREGKLDMHAYICELIYI